MMLRNWPIIDNENRKLRMASNVSGRLRSILAWEQERKKVLFVKCFLWGEWPPPFRDLLNAMQEFLQNEQLVRRLGLGGGCLYAVQILLLKIQNSSTEYLCVKYSRYMKYIPQYSYIASNHKCIQQLLQID